MRNYYSYLLGGDYDYEYAHTYYNKQIGNEEVENCQDLPEYPNQLNFNWQNFAEKAEELGFKADQHLMFW